MAKHRATSFRLPPDVYERLEAAADARDVSMNWIVARAIPYYLDRLIPVDELRFTRDPQPDEQEE